MSIKDWISLPDDRTDIHVKIDVARLIALQRSTDGSVNITVYTDCIRDVVTAIRIGLLQSLMLLKKTGERTSPGIKGVKSPFDSSPLCGGMY